MVSTNFLSGGITIIEEESRIRNLQGVATSIGAMVILAEKGQIGKATLVTSFEDFFNKFGTFVPYGMGAWAAKAFYENALGNTPMYIVRTAHYTDINDAGTLQADKAALSINDDANPTLLIEASSEGEWGNQLKVKTTRQSRFTYSTTSNLSNGGTSVTLDNVADIRKGTVLYLDDGSETVTVVVKSVQNLTIFFDAVTLAADVDSGADAHEQSFRIEVYEGDQLVEEHDFLSMEDTNEQDFVETRLNPLADTDQIRIRVTDLDSASTPGADRPEDLASPTFLAGGDNGLTGLTDGDFIGSAAAGNGLYAFDEIQVINLMAIPESQSQAVQTALITYCEGRKFPFAILQSPLGLTPTAMVTYRQDTLSANTSRAAMYYPQVKVYDANNDKNIVIPADGHIMGAMARTDNSNGVQQVAAGDLGQLLNIVGFENEEANKKGVRDILYPAQINPLANITNLGRVIFGSRTLSTGGGIGSQVNERRTFNFVEQTLNDGMGFVLFKNNTPELRKTVDDTISSFLVTLVQDGVLESFTVDVGDGLNNALVRAQNKLIAAVALKVPDTIEHFFIVVSKDTRAQEQALQELTT